MVRCKIGKSYLFAHREAIRVKQIKGMKKVRVAITGGIGCGKSAVAEYIESLGYLVYSCDEIYKRIFERKNFQDKLLKEFPACERDGKIDKKMLAACIFSDKIARERLNDLSHKEVFLQLEQFIVNTSQQLVFVEVPLLFEGGYQDRFDYVLVVVRDLNQRIQSIMQRDGLSVEEIMQRMAAQWDYQNNLAGLTESKYFILENNQNKQHLYKKIETVINSINETISVKQ